MKLLFTLTQRGFLLILMLLLSGMFTVAQADSYIDYIPKYRKFKSHYQIDMIEYKDKRTIMHFRYVVQEEGTTHFYNGNHPNSWYLRTPPRMRGLEIQFKQLEIKDIRINDEQKLETLTHIPEITYDTDRGDVVTFKVHFVRIPHYIRMLDMIEGQDGDLDDEGLNCFDIMVKTKESPMLGTPDNRKRMEERFAESIPYVKPKAQPKTTTVASNTTKKSNNSTLNPGIQKTEPTPNPTPREKEPIDYMPKALSSLDDMKCSERVILPNVTFRDNEVNFSGRVKALQNIRVVAEYLKAYPKANIILHGHTDIQGAHHKNLELSRERALSVKRSLVSMGVKRERIKIYFYGGKQPLTKYKNGGKENRRVEVEPICSSSSDKTVKTN